MGLKAEAGVTEKELAESALVEAAKGGDQDAFRRLVEPIQRELQVFCCRMTEPVSAAAPGA
jgi:DNA-directed RNA polymerase specialized sigma24 family protein